MSRPKFKELAYMLGVYSNKTIPQTYINEFSNYELLLSLLQKINEVIETVSGYNEVMNEIQALLDDLDDEIKAEVERLLQEMYDSGEFEDILTDVLYKYYSNATAPKEFKIDVRREFRVALYSMPYDATDYDNEGYFSMVQGGNYFKKNDTKYYVGCYRYSLDRNSYYTNDDVDVRLYAFLDGKWRFVRNRVYSLGHANDIKYIPHLNKFFVCETAEFNDGVEEGSFDIYVIDWELPAQTDATFTIDDTAIYPRRDKITCVDYFDDKYWFMIGSGGANPIQIYTFDLDIQGDTYTALNYSNYATFYVPNNAGTGNYVMQGAGFCQNEDFIFLGNTAPAGIYRFNKKLKKLDCFYNIGAYANSHMYPTGEVENLSIVDNIIYIGTAIHGNQRLSYFDYNQVFSFDFVNGLSCPNKAITTYGSYTRTIYVGMEGYPQSVDYYTREICNPNGLTGSNGMPFPTWEECGLFINAQDLWTTLTIVPLSKNTGGYLALDLGKCNIYIDGSSYYNSSTEVDELEKYPRIAGISVEGGSLDISRMLVMNRAPAPAGDYAKYQILTRFNMLNIHNSALIPYQRPEGSKLMMVNRGFANLGSIYTTNNALVDWDTTNLNFYICSINTHGHWVGSSTSNIIG